MKRILFFIVFISILPMLIFSQESQDAAKKQVAILEPVAVTKEVGIMHRSMVRGEMVKAIGRQEGYAAFTRQDIDQIMNEHNFQASGMVNEETRKRLGVMQGVDYVCITKITKEGNNFYLEASLVNIETGQISNPASQFGVLSDDGRLDNMASACEKLGAELVGKKVSTSSYSSSYSYSRPSTSSSSSSSSNSYSSSRPSSSSSATSASSRSTSNSYASAKVSSPDPDVEVEIISCKRSGNNVYFKYKVINTGLGDCNMLVASASGSPTGTFIFDNLGNSYSRSCMTIGNSNNNQGYSNAVSALLRDVPVQGTITVDNVPEEATTLTFKIGVSVCQGKSYTHMTFKNVPIN
ncbi:MAG: hypothetical protein IKV26_05300 [Paludibacteraceae bacterium]|nr:hypothetical protein [Paludibacteraceae bacterium]